MKIKNINTTKKHPKEIPLLQGMILWIKTMFEKITKIDYDIDLGKNPKEIPFTPKNIAIILKDSKKPVVLGFEFPLSEWNEEPKVSNDTENMTEYTVVAIDNGVRNGQAGIFVQDDGELSATSHNGIRFISFLYMKERMTFCAYSK